MSGGLLSPQACRYIKPTKIIISISKENSCKTPDKDDALQKCVSDLVEKVQNMLLYTMCTKAQAGAEMGP